MSRRLSAFATAGLLALLAAGMAHPLPALAQGDARWNALYDRIIRLEHQMKAMKRDYERRIRRLEAELRAARRNGAAPARRATPPAPMPAAPPARRIRRQGNAGGGAQPPLREPQLSIELEDNSAPASQEQMLGRLRAGDMPTASTGQPAAPAPRPAMPATGKAASGPIALPGAVTDAVGAGAGAANTGAATAGGLAPGKVAVAPLPLVGNGAASGATGARHAPTPSPVEPVSIPPALAKLSPDALLQKARQNFLARRYARAEQAYRVWLARFGNDPRAADATFELGETLYVQGRFKEAGKLFVNAYRAAPDGGIAPRALLRLGQALKRMGRKAEACKAWKSLRQRYPDSRAARLQAPLEMKRLKCKG